jgi:hypothetical protein
MKYFLYFVDFLNRGDLLSGLSARLFRNFQKRNYNDGQMIMIIDVNNFSWENDLSWFM